MEVVILGSGTYIPALNRNQSSYLVKVKGKNLVFDMGEGALKSLLKEGVEWTGIDAVFLSHGHPDHVVGCIGFLHLRAAYSSNDFVIYGWKGLSGFIESLGETLPLTKPRKYELGVVEMEDSRVDFDGYSVLSKPMKHKGNCLGFRVESDGKVVVYTGDADFSDELVELAKDADVLISDCNDADENKKEGHMSPSAIGKVAEKAGVKKLVLSHIMPPTEKYDIVSQAKKVFSGEVVKAEDGMRIEV